jgi:hypothetical protein
MMNCCSSAAIHVHNCSHWSFVLEPGGCHLKQLSITSSFPWQDLTRYDAGCETFTQGKAPVLPSDGIWETGLTDSHKAGGDTKDVKADNNMPPPPNPWTLVAQNAEQLTEVARDMVKRKSGPAESDNSQKVEGGREVTRLESLPQEIQLQIMRFLDHFSLYRLTQAYRIFHALAFDNIFESDPYWRTLRHTVDCMGDGPQNRVLPQGESNGEASGSGNRPGSKGATSQLTKAEFEY